MATMDRSLFDRQLLRLSRAFAAVPQTGMGDEYWARLKNHQYEPFVAAVDRMLDESDRFPNIATIHRFYYEERDKARIITAETLKSEEAMRDAGRKNAARLAREGLPSDRMVGMPVAVGSRQHEARLKFYDKMIATLMARIDERGAELDRHPRDADLIRRYGVLTQTLSEMCADRDHFEETGLPASRGSYAPGDPDPVPAGTLFLCPVCKATDESPGGFVRVEVSAGSRHFGGAGGGAEHTPVPCPACNRDGYARYVAKYGTPPGMPAVKVGAR